MSLTPQQTVLSHIQRLRYVRLSNISEQMRQVVIDLGMMEPPLVDAMGDFVSVTGEGLNALRK